MSSRADGGPSIAAEDRPLLQLRSRDSIGPVALARALATALPATPKHHEGGCRRAGCGYPPDGTGFASTVKVSFDSASASRFFRRITARYITPDMKKLFVLSMFLSFAMICSCQKQDSATEAQVAQRKAELEAREKAEAEREKALEALVEREKALAEREKAIGSAQTITPGAQSRGQVTDPAQMKALLGQGQVTDPAQMKAQKEKNLQQLPPEVHALIPDPAKVKAQRDAIMQEQLARRQRLLEEFQRKRMQAPKKDAMRHAEELKTAKEHAMGAATAGPGAVYPGAEATTPLSLGASPPPAYTAAPAAVYPGAEATSPPSLAASPAVEAASPTPSPTPQ